MTAPYTVLIPTHNRPQYLQRCTQWFLDIGCSVVIADSSTDAWTSELRNSPKVHYIHHPGGFDVYLQKLQMALAAVETPLVAMCADDDFITGAGLEASAAFLTANPDYSFCQGYSYTFQAFGSRLVVWPTQYMTHDVAAESWLDRVETARDTLYYGVHRTAVLRSVVDFLIERDFSEMIDSAVGFFDFCMFKAVARAGKLKRIPVPFGLREYSPVVSTVGTRYRTITSRNVPDFYAAFIDFMLKGDASDGARARLLKVACNEYAGLLNYEMSIAPSRKMQFSQLPPWVVRELEYLFRLYTAIRAFCTNGFLVSAKVFQMPDYRRFRRVIRTPRVAGGGRAGE